MPGIEVNFPAGSDISVFSSAIRPPLELTQSPIQWVQGALFQG